MPRPERASSSTPTAPLLLAAALSAFAPISWFFLETHAHAAFDAGQARYDWQVESLSDLGVDYRQVHPLKHHNVQSHRHATQNFNFLQAGVGLVAAQAVLLLATRARSAALLRTLRLLLALSYAGGMLLMARVHGGPREKHWRILGWHWMGFGMAAVGGNGLAILAAVRPTVGAFEKSAVYRLFGVLLGSVGLYSFYRFQTLGVWNFETKLGLWQRGTVYPVLAWEAVTAVVLVVASLADGATKTKTT